MRLTILLGVVVCALVVMPARAQSVPEVNLPPSPPGQAAMQVGGAWSTGADGASRYSGGRWVVVDYSRPLLRGRTNIFGSGAEYGMAVRDGAPVWRAGANATTTLTTQVPLMVGGTRLPPGVYNVVVDLAPGAWTLILGNQPRQPKYDPNDRVNLYGSINYDPTFELARVGMSVREGGVLEHPLEQFTIGFTKASERQLHLVMAWDRTIAVAPLEVVD